MKKFLSIFLAITMLITFITVPVSAEEETPEFEYYYNDNSSVIIHTYNGASENVIIPASIDGFTVIGINSNTFTSETAIKSVILPASITCVNGYAFNSIPSLERVEFLSDGKRNLIINSKAFNECPSLNTIILPSEKVYSIDSTAFYGCGYVNSEDNWLDNALCLNDILLAVNANELAENYIVKEGTTIIANDIFSVYDEETETTTRNVKNIILPESIKVIGEFTFIDVESLGSALERIGLFGEIRGLEFVFDSILNKDKYTESIERTGYVEPEDLHIELIDGDFLLAAVPMTILSSELVKDPMYIIPEGIRYISDDYNMLINDIPGKILSISYSNHVVFPESFETLPLDNPLCGDLYNVLSGFMCQTVTFLNKDTVIYDDIDTISGWIKTICGYKGSTAEAYAKKYDRTFIDIENCTHDLTVKRGVISSTCDRTGYTGDTYCAYCGQFISTGSKTDIHNLYFSHTESYNGDCYDTLAVYECMYCDYSITEIYTPGTGHIDEDFDGRCDKCYDFTDKAKACTCKVCRMHVSIDDDYFKHIIPIIIVSIWRLFRIKEFCADCGLQHWNR